MTSRLRLLVVLAFGLFCCGAARGQGPPQASSPNDSVCAAMLFAHLRSNFDDIHDVSMRFHHRDHRLNGMIVIDMQWADGRMTSARVVQNETRSHDLAEALVARLRTWYIEGLVGPFRTRLPLRIKIVCSDDSTFSRAGILTGVIRDPSGAPVRDATVSFHPAADARDTLRTCYSNREGVFVKTLIPAGTWNVECRGKGFEPVVLRNVRFRPGEHIRKAIALRRLE